jgi:hypothetical protein
LTDFIHQKKKNIDRIFVLCESMILYNCVAALSCCVILPFL